MARVDVGRLRVLVDEKYLSVQQHPAADLLIWSYTPKTQFERHWTPETRMCRGLITTGDGTVVARPFEKFFGLEELASVGLGLPDEPFEVYEKLDGSLGILYWPDGDSRPSLATRGSFSGIQAQRGTAILQARYGHVPFRRDVTYLFEILYPENRIVVDYGDREDVVLLAALDTETGADLPLSDLNGLGVPLVRRYDGVADLKALQAPYRLERDLQEGFVVRYRSGLRVKVKLPEYVRLHRLLTGVTPRFIWEQLRDGRRVDDLLDRVPDGFARWIRHYADTLRAAHDAIERACRADFCDVGDRRLTAARFQACRYPAILFRMLDGKPYDDVIWKLVKPAPAAPYWNDKG